jgi:light-regulated signal transduction histidine kinase (bacteriophytochrome)
MAPDADAMSGALSVAAHDVTEALRVVTGYLELLDAQAGDALDETAQRYLGGVRDGLGHLERVTSGVLTYVSVNTEPPDIEDVEVDIAFEEALRPLHRDLDERGARIQADELPTIRADAGRTRDLLRALAANAVTFASDEPLRLDLTAERDDDGWRFALRDNGIGLPADARERVLQPFERGHSRSVATGPGLGLAIARCIVERRGGRIAIDSSPEGTTVTFTVPDEVPTP